MSNNPINYSTGATPTKKAKGSSKAYTYKDLTTAGLNAGICGTGNIVTHLIITSVSEISL